MSECKCGDVDDEVCDGCWKTNWKLQIDFLTAEVERLREVVRKVHALAGMAVSGTSVWEPLVDIHKLTKGEEG